MSGRNAPTGKFPIHCRDSRLPSGLVPCCHVCGGRMGVHVRKGRHFVQDGQWYASNECYQDFMEKACAGNALLLEPGLGYDTPTIIRFPFERLASQMGNVTLARINRDYPDAQSRMADLVPFDENIGSVLTDVSTSKLY